MEDSSENIHQQDQPVDFEPDETKRFRWVPIEYDTKLQGEGLMSLEVLQDDDELPVIKKAKKTKKEPKENKAPKDDKKLEDTDKIDDVPVQQVEDATKKWNTLLFDDWNIPTPVRRNLYNAGMLTPTVIQKIVFKPSLTTGANIVACAETVSFYDINIANNAQGSITQLASSDSGIGTPFVRPYTCISAVAGIGDCRNYMPLHPCHRIT